MAMNAGLAVLKAKHSDNLNSERNVIEARVMPDVADQIFDPDLPAMEFTTNWYQMRGLIARLQTNPLLGDKPELHQEIREIFKNLIYQGAEIDLQLSADVSIRKVSDFVEARKIRDFIDTIKTSFIRYNTRMANRIILGISDS